MKNIWITITAVLLALSGHVCAQPAGTLDVTFNGTGKVVYDNDLFDLYQDVKVQPDGKIVAVGTSMDATYTPYVVVSRYLTDGTPDLTFGTNGQVTFSYKTETGAYKCLIKDNGKILICGYSTDYSLYGMLLLQLNPDGGLDPSFGSYGVVYQVIGTGVNTAYAMALRQDGKILVSGYTQDINYNNVPVVLRYSENGTPDPTFGTGGMASIPVTQSDNDFSAISIQSDGKILAAGHISNGLSWFSLLVARFDTGGVLDNTYGTSGIVNLNLNNVDDEFFGMQVEGNNETVLTGFTVNQVDTYYHLLLMKFDSSGHPVTGFGTNGSVISGTVPYTVGNALVLQPNGKIVVAGCTGDLQPANNDWALWRFNADGSPDTEFGNNGLTTTDFFGNADEALGIALFADKIILAGKTRNATNYLDFAVARYVNDVNVVVPEISRLRSFSVSPNPVKQNGRISLKFDLERSGDLSVSLLSSDGTLVLEQPLRSQAEGKHAVQLSLPPDVSPGFYYIRIKGSSFTGMPVRKLVVY